MEEYDFNFEKSLERIADSAERIAVSLEKMAPPGGQDREAIKIVGRKESTESRKSFANVIRDILIDQVQVSDSRQQPYPTEHTPNPDEELRSDELGQQSGTPPHQ